jgi:hypothetical protein
MTFKSLVPLHRVTGLGSLQPFTIVALCELGVARRSVALMSSESGYARLSPFTSLHRTPCHPEPGRIGLLTVTHQQGHRPRVVGARRSEVKGETWAKPRSEDMSGGGHPPPSAHAAMEPRA